MRHFLRTALPGFCPPPLTVGWVLAAELPARYYRLIKAVCAGIEKRAQGDG